MASRCPHLCCSVATDRASQKSGSLHRYAGCSTKSCGVGAANRSIAIRQRVSSASTENACLLEAGLGRFCFGNKLFSLRNASSILCPQIAEAGSLNVQRSGNFLSNSMIRYLQKNYPLALNGCMPPYSCCSARPPHHHPDRTRTQILPDYPT